MVTAFAAAGDALDTDDLPRAIELLTWAKSAASRSPAVREALGVAYYRAEDYAAASRELQAYRRLSGREDQNHLLADCSRASGRHDKVAELVDAMVGAPQVPRERLAEAAIVLAGDRADHGDIDGALAALHRADLEPETVADHHLRLWYLAADLHERKGEPERAREYLEAIAAVSDGYLDVEERLSAENDIDDGVAGSQDPTC